MVDLWLCEDVPFNNTYEDVVSFDNQDLQQSYFLSLMVHHEKTNRFRFIDNKITFRIKRTYESSQKINYMVILQDGKYYYLFVDSVAYVDPDTTFVNATVDVWQTYQFEHEIKDAFIDREHQDRFKKVGNKLEPIYNLEKENLELGDKYDTISNITIEDPNQHGDVINDLFYLYFISTKPLNDKDVEMRRMGPIFSGSYVYMAPFSFSDNRNYYFNRGKLGETDWHGLKATDRLALHLTDPNIVAIYISRYSAISLTYKWGQKVVEGQTIVGYEVKPYLSGNSQITDKAYDVIKSLGLIPVTRFENDVDFNIEDMIKVYSLGDINDNKDINLEPKLDLEPYTQYTFTNGLIEPINFGGNELEKNIRYVETYNLDYKVFIGFMKNDLGLYYGEHSSKNSELPLLTDKYLEYKANSKASSTTGLALGALQVGSGVGLSLLGGGFGRYVGLRQAISGGQQIANELVKQSDLKNAPRGVKEIGNNLIHTMNYINQNNFRISLKLTALKRQIKNVFYERTYEYLYRMGYKVNNFGVPNIRSRYYFNYLILSDVAIGGNLNNNIKNELETIYKNGTTIWHKRGNKELKIYDYTKENWEVSLLE